MSTTDYLNQLDLGQLCFAREQVNKLIAQKEDEPRVLIWQVCDDSVVLAHFAKDD